MNLKFENKVFVISGDKLRYADAAARELTAEGAQVLTATAIPIWQVDKVRMNSSTTWWGDMECWTA